MRLLKRLALVAGALVAVLVLIGATLVALGGRKLAQTHEVRAAALAVPSDSAAVARGAHLVATNGCLDCHGADLAGQVMIDAPPFRVVASNLTAGEGGVGARYADADWNRAIRHGVRPGGRALLVMPSRGYHQLSDRDAAALIAYLKTVPPVDRALPPTQVRLLGRALSAVALDPAFEVNPAPTAPDHPAPGPTTAYGAYLASVTCTYCHGETLRGAQPPNPDSPPAPDLAAAAGWPLDVFTTALRTGVAPGGRRLDPEFMPISFTQAMTDDEIAALHAHLRALVPGA